MSSSSSRRLSFGSAVRYAKKHPKNFVFSKLPFAFFLEAYDFKYGEKRVLSFLDNLMCRYSSRLGGYPIAYASTKVNVKCVIKDFQCGAHIVGSVVVVVFRPQNSIFEATIRRVDSEMVIADVCGISVHVDTSSLAEMPQIGEDVTARMLKMDLTSDIYRLTCVLLNR